MVDQLIDQETKDRAVFEASFELCPLLGHLTDEEHTELFFECWQAARDHYAPKRQDGQENTVASIPDEELLRRAVKGAKLRGRRGYKYQRWTAVAEQFQLGSTYAAQLCRRFNLDPDEMVKI